ncbi:MAG: hypothetical protein LBI43_00700 [Streptococcaceae bacterium]|jgi:hypothetical protein|nr:hypothetical protein [Streptococcaceae bacterium]
MKKGLNAVSVLIALLGIVLVAALFCFFVWFLGETLYNPKVATLYSVLRSIDYALLLRVFGFTLIGTFLIDLLLIWLTSSWQKLRGIEIVPVEAKSALMRFWLRHRRIHLTMLMLALFVTIGITAPQAVMAGFTAIVSISVLVSNSIRKLEK